MAVWRNKIRLSNFLRGWAKKHSGFYKKEKEWLLALINILDVHAKTTPLNDFERKELREAHEVLADGGAN
jgi:hypothetical protein